MPASKYFLIKMPTMQTLIALLL